MLGSNVDDSPAALSERQDARLILLEPELAAPPGWSWFNPSVAADPWGGFLATVRCSNYALRGWEYETAEGDGVIRTRTALMKLDSDLCPQWSRWIDDTAARVRPPLFPVHGLEDMRLFQRAGRWWVVASVREHSTSGEVRQLLGELADVEGKPTLAHPRRLPSPVRGASGETAWAEKNWMPIPDSTPRPAFVWSVDPLVVVEFDRLTGQVVERSRRATAGHDHRLRGSGPVFASPWGSLGIVHEVAAPGRDGSRPYRRYTHRFVGFDPHVSEATIGAPWTIGHDALEYVAGGCVSAGQLVLSYGREDAEAWVLSLPLSEVRDLSAGVPHVVR